MSTSGVMTLILVFLVGMLYVLTRPWGGTLPQNTTQAIIPTPTVQHGLPQGAPNAGNTQTLISTVKLLEQSNSGQTGTAMVFDQNGKINIVVTMDTLTPGSEYAASISQGTCAGTSDTVYTLTPVESGKSVTLLGVPQDTLRSQLPLSLGIYRSDADQSSILSCGQLSL